MPEQIEYFDAQGKAVPEAQAVIYISRVTNESGKVIREQVGFPAARDKESSLVDAMTILAYREGG